MLHITTEDCLHAVDNRFQLVILAALRSKKILLSGEEPLVSWNKNKVTVVALREISKNKINNSYFNL